VVAPAKLNLTLEVLGKRDDGYHEIMSLMQTIDLADAVRLDLSDQITLRVEGEPAEGLPADSKENLAYRAATALAREAGRNDLGATISLEKRIPASSGLGGGSSDAAAVLRGLNRLWGLDLPVETLTAVAASLGSDVAFFLHGGTALATGRGEIIEELPDAAEQELTLFVPKLGVENKTQQMYALITPIEYSKGSVTTYRLAKVRNGSPFLPSDPFNIFGRHIGDLAPIVEAAMAVCDEAHLWARLAGAGPAFFSLTPLDQIPERLIVAILRESYGVTSVPCRFLPRAAATAITES
jgi:4-diphosphocytidyl-2-C-methyl-D-erythritol kinase